MAALETGVERKAGLVMLQEPSEVIEGIKISDLAYEIRKRKRVGQQCARGAAWQLTNGQP